jgi:hypothetical protein
MNSPGTDIRRMLIRMFSELNKDLKRTQKNNSMNLKRTWKKNSRRQRNN